MLGSCGIVAFSLLLWGGSAPLLLKVGAQAPPLPPLYLRPCTSKLMQTVRRNLWTTPVRTPPHLLYHPTPSVYSQLLTSLLLLWGPSPPLSKHLSWVALPQNKIPLPMNKRANCLCGKHDLRTLIVAHTTGFSTATYPGYFLLLTAPIHAVTAFANGQRVRVELQR